MQDPKSLSSVALFHETFKHPILPQPTIPSETRCALRVSLLAEELKELEEAIENKDLVEIADALYGVTMRGDGVSEVISQRIREVDAVS